MRLREIATVVTIAVGNASPARPQQPTDTSRCTGRWLPARPLHTHDGYTIIAPRASVLPWRGKTLLAAWPLRTNESAGHIVYPLAPGLTTPIASEQIPMAALTDSGGEATLFPSPSGLSPYPMHFEASRDDAGVVHALFGSDDSIPVNSIIAVRSVWYTRLEGETWTAPERILTSDAKVLFTPSYRSPILARGGVLHAVVAMEGEGLRYLRRHRDVWTVRHVDIPRDLMGYPRIAALSSGRLVLIVQAGVLDPRTSWMSSVDVTWSDDAGASWTPPRRISMPAEEPVYDLHLFADERDVLYAFWYQQTESNGTPALRPIFGASPGRIHAATSQDSGTTWRHSPPSTLLPNAGELQMLLLPNQTALAALLNPRDEQIITMAWSGSWSTPEPIPASPQPFNPSLGLGGAQRPVLVWGITHQPDWTTTMMTTYTPCR